jgi:hypothetical protein
MAQRFRDPEILIKTHVHGAILAAELPMKTGEAAGIPAALP